jgi:hypothetical protein
MSRIRYDLAKLARFGARVSVESFVSPLDYVERSNIRKDIKKMNTTFVKTQDGVFKRILLLYGLYTLLSNAAYLFGYYLLPEGFMRGGPGSAPARVVAATGTFWSEFALTFLFNLVLVVLLSVIWNVLQVNGFPVGYLYPIALAVGTGLVSGTNSFLQSDLRQYNVWDGTALALSIGNVEMLGTLLIIASTAAIGVYQFSSWWQLKPTKVMNLRDVRLSRAEMLCLASGILLLIIAAYRESVMAMSL